MANDLGNLKIVLARYPRTARENVFWRSQIVGRVSSIYRRLLKRQMKAILLTNDWLMIVLAVYVVCLRLMIGQSPEGRTEGSNLSDGHR